MRTQLFLFGAIALISLLPSSVLAQYDRSPFREHLVPLGTYQGWDYVSAYRAPQPDPASESGCLTPVGWSQFAGDQAQIVERHSDAWSHPAFLGEKLSQYLLLDGSKDWGVQSVEEDSFCLYLDDVVVEVEQAWVTGAFHDGVEWRPLLAIVHPTGEIWPEPDSDLFSVRLPDLSKPKEPRPTPVTPLESPGILGMAGQGEVF